MVGAVAVHGVCGAWGTIAVGLFIPGSSLGETTRVGQVMIQATGVLACFAWAFGMTFLILKILNFITPLRVTPEEDRVGLNIAEHGASSSVLDLVHAMHIATKTGNFTEEMKIEGEIGTEMGDLAQGFNRMIDAIQRTRRERDESYEAIKGHVGALIRSSKSMTSDMEYTKQRASAMSDFVNDIATVIREATDSLRDVSSKTNYAATISRDVAEKAVDGKSAMDALGASAGKISEVLDLIRLIAFQTNLLAINATIEAARAGQAGRGFAVVATQVKQLALQTAEAAVSIRAQIEEMQKKCEFGRFNHRRYSARDERDQHHQRRDCRKSRRGNSGYGDDQ